MQQRSLILLVFFTVFMDLLGFGILIPILPYIALDYQATPLQIGMLMAVYSMMQFLFSPIWGRLSDIVGRRPILILSLFGSTAGYIIFALSTSMTGLFISRILAGIAAANISTAQAVMADLLPIEKRTMGMGIVGAAIGMGFALGPGIGAIAVSEHNYTFPILLAALLSGIDLVLVLILLPETYKWQNSAHPARRKFSLQILREAAKSSHILILLGISLLYYIAFAAMESTYALFGEANYSMKAWQNGAVLMCAGLIMAIVQGGILSRVTNRFGETPVFLCGAAGVLVGLFCIGASSTFYGFVGSTMLLAVSAGFVTPIISSLLSQLSGPNVQGGILGLNQSMASLGRILGPLSGTMLFEEGHRYPFYLGAVLVFVLWILAFSLHNRLAHARSQEV